jgi:ABC-type dipeptide/oligopeptide/nickel transport system permease component
MLEVLRQDYIRTARSKGLTDNVVFIRHALRKGLIPVITMAGFQLEGLLSGTVILESLFGLPGMGQGIVAGATFRDYPVIQSLALIMVAMTLFLNLIVDLSYTIIDPRIRYPG